MVLDYKDTRFSFDKKRRQKRIRQIKIIAAIVILLTVYLFIANLLDSGKVNRVQHLLLSGEVEKAAARFDDIKGFIYHRSVKKELQALICLYRGDYDGAARVFKELGQRESAYAAEKYTVFLDHFLDSGQYRQLDMYSDYLRPFHPEVSYYKACARTALFDARQSSRAINSLAGEEREKRARAIAIIEAVNRGLDTGKINYIFDINNKPLAYYDLKKKRTVSLTPGFDFSLFNHQLKGGLKFYKLTLDLDLQKAIHRQFRRRNGSFLLFDLRDNSIAAAYSKPVQQKNQDAVFTEHYEAGSIVKVVTLFSYLKNVPDQGNLFPYYCRGFVVLNNKIYYDWLKHQRVKTPEEALVVSCNAVFSHMAIRVGSRKLAETFRQFYFNAVDIQDLFLPFKTGRFNPDIQSDLQLARMSSGIKEVKVTTFHSALLAAIVAQNGAIRSPHLIKNIKNVLRLGFYNHSSEIISISRENRIFETIKSAMVGVTEEERSTGAKARVDFMHIAIKTGTAGEKKLGFDAIIMGFFPAHKPQYAFAFRLERGGKAQVQGAHFLKEFLTHLHHQKNKAP
jgi:hypothetical protein